MTTPPAFQPCSQDCNQGRACRCCQHDDIGHRDGWLSGFAAGALSGVIGSIVVVLMWLLP